MASGTEGLQIIGSGFGRTGTLSLKKALEQLGFGPCHHMEEVFGHPEQVPYWQAVAAGTPVDWSEVFAGYRSQVDWPGAHVWRETAAAFPNAKVIHTTRPEAKWWDSFSGTIGKLLAEYETMPFPPHVSAMMQVGWKLIGPQTMGAIPVPHEAALAAFRRREAEVRATIPADRLLVFDVAEGWEPLCRFLGVPVPDAPFPRTNDKEGFWKLVTGQPA